MIIGIDTAIISVWHEMQNFKAIMHNSSLAIVVVYLQPYIDHHTLGNHRSMLGNSMIGLISSHAKLWVMILWIPQIPQFVMKWTICDDLCF